MAKDTSTEVAIATPEQIEQARAAILDGELIPYTGDPETMSRAIVERILGAETAEEILTPQSLAAWRDYLDHPFTLKTFHLNRSSFEQGSSVYAVCDLVSLDDGAEMQVTCGGRNVLAQMLRLLELGTLPADVKLTSKRTQEGYEALWLVPAA